MVPSSPIIQQSEKFAKELLDGQLLENISFGIFLFANSFDNQFATFIAFPFPALGLADKAILFISNLIFL